MPDKTSVFLDVSVLCVEDEPVTLQFLTETLHPHVRRVYSAKDGREGLFEFARNQPDIVITDVEMPRMDGLEMARNIRSMSHSTVLILLTGLEEPEILKQGIQLKADGFLSKPVLHHDLLEIVERHAETILLQHEARTQRRLHELILDSLPYPIALLNTATFQILFANSEARHLGIMPDEPADGPFFPEAVRRSILKSMTLVEMMDRSALPLELQAAGKNWEATISPVTAGTSLYVAVDVTARRHLEKLKEDVERITRHDMKGPLGAIIGLPDMLLQHPGLPPETMQALTLIRNAGHTMLNQINLSLDLFKMEQGSYELSPQPVDITALIREILPQVNQLIGIKRLRVDVLLNGRHVLPDERFFVSGEKLLCFSMLANLLKNAMEASPQNGTVTMRLTDTPNGPEIAIHNKGSVPLSIRQRFFEKYTTAGKRYGTGLGVYSAALIARTQGGNISMTTSEVAGTWVTIKLPCPPRIFPE